MIRIWMGLMLMFSVDAYAADSQTQNHGQEKLLAKTLYEACVNGDLDTARRLIDEVGIDTVIPGPGGVPALNVAALNGHVEIVGFLLGKGANPNRKRAILNAQTPLQDAKEKGYTQIIELLEKAGAH